MNASGIIKLTVVTESKSFIVMTKTEKELVRKYYQEKIIPLVKDAAPFETLSDMHLETMKQSIDYAFWDASRAMKQLGIAVEKALINLYTKLN